MQPYEPGYPCLRQDGQPRRLRLLLTCVPGLEELAAQMLPYYLPEAEELHPQRGKLFLTCRTSLDHLWRLGFVDNVYLFLDQLPIGPHKVDLAAFGKALEALPSSAFSPVLPLEQGLRYRLTVSASRSGKHSYSRFDVAQAAKDALCRRRCFLPGEPEAHDLSLRVDVQDGLATVCLKLSSAAFRFRGEGRGFSAGAIRPAIANALVLLTQPKGDDVFLDPFCGSGTIAFERAQLPARRVLASDISPEALEIARQNLPVAVRLQRCDARSLPHKDASIDAIASNIPWDVQIQVDDLLALYVDFLREAGRLLKPGGALVLLTDKQEALETACRKTGWHADRLALLSLHGLHPGIFRLRR